MKFKLFVSYSSKDEAALEPILDGIRRAYPEKIDYFFAKESLRPGDDNKKVILKNVNDSNVFLLFHSSSAQDTAYIQHEIGAASALEKRIIIMLLDDARPEGMLKGINYLDLTDEKKFDSEIKRLHLCIAEELAKHEQIVNSRSEKAERMKQVSNLPCSVTVVSPDVDNNVEIDPQKLFVLIGILALAYYVIKSSRKS